MAFTPFDMIKDGDVVRVFSPSEFYQFTWDGYVAIGELPEFPRPGSIPLALIGEKGDLVVGTAQSTPGILPSTGDGFLLLTDPTSSTGLSWVDPTELGIGSVLTNGWSPILSVVVSGSRNVLQIVDWIGGTAGKPSTTNQFIGPTGIVSTAAAAVDIRGGQGTQGIQGIQGVQGNPGTNGWAPTLSVVADGSRSVLQIVDWVGGTGTKPSTTNQFVGPTGIVSTAAAAVDIRGAQGTAGTNGTNGTNGATPTNRGVSTTSLAIGTGSKTWTVTAMPVAFGVGSVVRASSDANTANYMTGIVTAATTTSVTLSVTEIGGSGTKADWTLNVSGFRGSANIYGPAGTVPGPYPDGTVTYEY